MLAGVATFVPSPPILVHTPIAYAEEIPIVETKEWSNETTKVFLSLKEMESAGGDCTAIGASGEIGCFQFLRSTWNTYSKDILGEIVELTKENEERVVRGKIQQWLDEGNSPRQIFLMWNQGHSGPCIKGVNKHGVKYDSCAYAEKAQTIYESL